MTLYRRSKALKKRLNTARWYQRITQAEKWFLGQELKYYKHCANKVDKIEYKLLDPDGAEADDIIELANNKLVSYKKKISKVRSKNKIARLTLLTTQINSICLVLSFIAGMKKGKNYQKASNLIQEYSLLTGENK